jgi:hypothetical protein
VSDEEQAAEADGPGAAAALAALPPLDVGLHFDIPHERYHADPCPEPSLSASTAKRLVQECALEGWYYHPRLGKGQEDGSAASRGGSLIDTLLMGYGPTIVVVPYDGYQSKDAKRMRDEAVALGKMPIIEKKFDAAMVAVDAVKKRLIETRGFAFDGKSQVTMVWRQGSIWCRGRIDHLKTLIMYDLKWYESSSPRAVKRACGEYGIEIQAVAYEEAMGDAVPGAEGRVPVSADLHPEQAAVRDQHVAPARDDAGARKAPVEEGEAGVGGQHEVGRLARPRRQDARRGDEVPDRGRNARGHGARDKGRR